MFEIYNICSFGFVFVIYYMFTYDEFLLVSCYILYKYVHLWVDSCLVHYMQYVHIGLCVLFQPGREGV